MRKITRREFLRHTAGVVAGYELSRRLDWPSSNRASADSWPSVVVAKGTNADSAAAILKTALDGMGGIGRFVQPGQTVAIKPNATWDYPPNTASSTDPDLLAALILMVREAGAKRIIVMDHCSLEPGTAECLRVNGIGQVVDSMDVEKVFPDRYLAPRELFTPVALPQGKAFQKMGVIKAAVEADVRINMAVAKSHMVTKLTMCLKHMMGFLELPGALHAQLEQGIADLSTPSRIQAQLHILEAIRVRMPVGRRLQAGGPETDLTDPQRVKRMNQIIAGADPVLIDAYGCVNLFGRKPKELAHVLWAAEAGLGEIDVEKAAADGRLRVFVVGQPTPTPTATATQTATATPPATATVQAIATPVGPTATHTPVPTDTPVPTNTPLPTNPPPAAIPVLPEQTAEAITTSAAACDSTVVVNPNPFLSGALIPVAAIVAGVGVVAHRRLERKEEAGPGEESEHDD